jgi:DNA-binding response OmpR family regulator
MKILVADDDEVLTSLIEGCLSAQHDVSSVYDGNDVITAFIDGHRLKDPFDIILLDINLPHMSGDKILQRIRKHEKKHLIGEKRTFIAIISGYTDANMIKKSINDGCDHYFIKPINIDKITNTLNAVSPQVVSHKHEHHGIPLKA